MSSDQIRTYKRAESAVFSKTKEVFGGLSNMAAAFPLRVNGIRILTSEALYQACRFPHQPEVQQIIIGEASPMTAKMKSKPYRKDTRPDWDRVRVKIMRWCLRVKLAQNWNEFSRLLLATRDRAIVEESRKDDFWGAKVVNDDTLVGMNVLGRLLMELREEVKQGNREQLSRVEPLAIPDFLLYGEPISAIDVRAMKTDAASRPVPIAVHGSVPYEQQADANPPEPRVTQTALFDNEHKIEASASRSGGLIDALTPYSEYKESGEAWVGAIPKRWGLLPNRAIFAEVKDKNHSDEEMLSVTITRGIIRQKALLENSSKKDSSNQNKSAYKLVCPHDIAYNKMRAWQGAIGVSDYRGIISPAYIVMRLRENNNARYFHHLFRTPQFAKEAERWSYGITSDMWSLRPEHFKMIYIPLPSADEQAAIVRFLDHVNRRIERAIRAKQKVIALLNAQKQAIIHRAVTRGLDPSASVKPSGTPWLGDIPGHWEILRARFLFRVVTRRDVRNDDPKLSVTQRRGIVPTEEMEENSTQARSFERFQVCHPGDLVLNKYKAHLGVFWCAKQRGLITPNYTVFRPARELETKYFELLFHTRPYRDAFSMMVYGVTEGMSPLYTQDFYRVPVVFPPATEQRKIVDEIAFSTKQEDVAITRTEREIDLIREYRARLIADVVTGKLDVRETARHLPTETEEPEVSPGPDADEAEDMESLTAEDA